MKKALQWALIGLMYIWSSPMTLLALLLWAATDWPTGGKFYRTYGNAVMVKVGKGFFYGYFRFTEWWMDRFSTKPTHNRWNFAGCCFGVVILVDDEVEPPGVPDDATRTSQRETFLLHEGRHAFQFMTWGPLIIVAYLFSTVVQMVRGKNGYYDNYFELDARRNEEEGKVPVREMLGWT